MTEWFARAVLHVTDVEASLRFYIDRLGFTNPWRYEEDGRVHVAQAERRDARLSCPTIGRRRSAKGSCLFP